MLYSQLIPSYNSDSLILLILTQNNRLRSYFFAKLSKSPAQDVKSLNYHSNSLK